MAVRYGGGVGVRMLDPVPANDMAVPEQGGSLYRGYQYGQLQ